MEWRLSNRASSEGRAFADRHYNRQSVGATQFVPPGRCLVLVTNQAFWVTSWPFAEFVKHDWPGAWICSAFRREGGPLASDLILEAIAATLWKWPIGPENGMVTFIDPSKVRHKRDPGRCFRKAGFKEVGKTKGGLTVLQLLPDGFPFAMEPIGAQGVLIAV